MVLTSGQRHRQRGAEVLGGWAPPGQLLGQPGERRDGTDEDGARGVGSRDQLGSATTCHAFSDADLIGSQPLDRQRFDGPLAGDAGQPRGAGDALDGAAQRARRFPGEGPHVVAKRRLRRRHVVAQGTPSPAISALSTFSALFRFSPFPCSPDSSRIQTGTEQDYHSGAAHRDAWGEILPAAETVISTGSAQPQPPSS